MVSLFDSFRSWIGQTGTYCKFLIKIYRTQATLRGLNPYLGFQVSLGDR